MKFHGANDSGLAGEPPFAGDGGIFQSGFFLRLLQAFLVTLRVPEIERVGRGQGPVVLPVLAVVEEHFQPRLGGHFEMKTAFGATEGLGQQVLLPKDLLAIFALHPEPFGLNALGRRAFGWRLGFSGFGHWAPAREVRTSHTIKHELSPPHRNLLSG